MACCAELIQRQAKIVSIEDQLFKHEVPVTKNCGTGNARNFRNFAKSCTDKLIATSALIILLPLLLLVSIAIKLDSKGPIIFKQKRNGLNNQVFNIWKFRTMSVMENGTDVAQAKKGDSRITRTGNFLRKSSIDELPQLVNVLFGDMSIVGPRPHPVALNDQFRPLIEDYDKRCAMKPGLTGWAQINGYRGPTDTVEQMQTRIEYDMEYIETWTLWGDLKIMLATPYHGLFNKNAF